MATWIALLRGINVVGKRLLPMQELADHCARAGCGEPRTYIASGNVVFRGPKRVADALPARLAERISKSRGFAPRVVVLSAAELAAAIAANPFPAAVANPKLLHLFFLAEVPASADLEALGRLATGREAFALTGKVFYLHTPDGFPSSKLASRAERLIGVDATARNWRTATTLHAMAAELG